MTVEEYMQHWGPYKEFGKEMIHGWCSRTNWDDGKSWDRDFHWRDKLCFLEDEIDGLDAYSILNDDAQISVLLAMNGLEADEKDIFRNAEYPVVISSHIDTVQEGEGEGITLPFCRFTKKGYIHGTLDNGITNALCELGIFERMFSPAVAVAYTGDEEKNDHGAKEVAEYVMRTCTNAKKITFITLDVTFDDAWKKAAFTVENDFLPFGSEDSRKLIDTCNTLGEWRYKPAKEDEFPGYLPKKCRLYGEGAPDESVAYHECCPDARVFSICLPTNDSEDKVNMHTDRGIKARESDFRTYMHAVVEIANMFAKG